MGNQEGCAGVTTSCSGHSFTLERRLNWTPLVRAWSWVSWTEKTSTTGEERARELLHVNGDTDMSNTNYKLSSLAWPAERGHRKKQANMPLSPNFLCSFKLEKITFVINVINLFPKWNLTLSTLLEKSLKRYRWRLRTFLKAPNLLSYPGLSDTYISSRS